MSRGDFGWKNFGLGDFDSITKKDRPGNPTGNPNGDLTDNPTGDLTGDLTVDLTGDPTGDTRTVTPDQ